MLRMRVGMGAVASFVFLAAAGAHAANDTLVVKSPSGTYQPAAATSWKNAQNAVVFKLADGVDGQAIAKLLSERLASAKVSFAAGELTVSGIPEAALLDQLSTLSLSGGADPLADLAGLGGAAVAMDAPEGGGSIRASKPIPMPARAIKPHDPAERADAEVMEIKQGVFPSVALKLRIKRSAGAGPLKAKLQKGKTIEATVVYAAADGSMDVSAPENQRNMVAWYLSRGDRISLHAAANGAAIEIDWLERKNPTAD